MDKVHDSGSTGKKSEFLADFKQQNASAWVPRFTSASVSQVFIGFGVLLVPIGIAVLVVSSDTSDDIKDINVDYTYCRSIKNSSITCAEFLKSQNGWLEEGREVCQCDVRFELPKPMKGKKIYMYYALENFYQNNRLYVRSKDQDQLLGKIGTYEQPKPPTKDCESYDYDSDGKIIFPCGAIANSMFNDSLQLYHENEVGEEIEIKQIRRGIAWTSDVKFRYKNPPEFRNESHPIWTKFTKPKAWSRSIWDLDRDDHENNGIQNEDFIVWMRTAAFSDFRKLYRIIDTKSQDLLKDGLPQGTYHLKVNYTFEVVSFEGKKGITLVAPTIFGQQNLFQGIALSSVGGFSVVLGLLFLLCGCSSRQGKGSFRRSNAHEE